MCWHSSQALRDVFIYHGDRGAVNLCRCRQWTGEPVRQQCCARACPLHDNAIVCYNVLRILCAAQVGAEFLAQHYSVHTVLLPNPTWANHNKIFPLAGIKDVRKYRYFKPSTKGLDYEVCSMIKHSPPHPNFIPWPSSRPYTSSFEVEGGDEGPDLGCQREAWCIFQETEPGRGCLTRQPSCLGA